MCSCGALQENVKHYFMECPNFAVQRTELFNSVSTLTPININNFVFGNQNISLDDNIAIFNYVHKYILDTQRFEV